MKIIFVMNDSWSSWIEYEHTGILNQPKRRAVTIELTEDQINQIGLREMGVDNGEPVFETIESVSIEGKSK